MPDLWDFVDDRYYDNRNREIARKEKELEKANAYLEKARQAELEKRELEKPKSVIDDLLSGEKRQLPKHHQRMSLTQIKKQKAKANQSEVIKDDELDFADLGLLHIEKDKDERHIEKEKTKAEDKDNDDVGSLPAIEALQGGSGFDLRVELPSEIPTLEMEPIKIDIQEPSREEYTLKNMLSKKLEILQSKKRHKDFERHREIKQATFDRYEKDIKKVSKVLGEEPSQKDVLQYVLKMARGEKENNYFHILAGIREGYRDIYNDIYLALPKKYERDNMRLNYKRSGFDVRENRVVEARQQGVEQDVLNRVIADLPLEWHREAVKLIQITGCRRNEIENMTMKLTGRGNRATITIEWVVSKQKNGKENFNKITLHQEHFPDEFKELGTMLLHRNGCNSLRNSTFEKVRVFDDTRQNGEALAKAFQRSRRKLGLNKDLYKLHSLRHQLGTDLRNSGMDDLGIAHRLGQKLYKNANIYGINK